MPASKVQTAQQTSVVRKIPSAAIMVLGMIAITERGPIGSTELLFDWPDYQATYGSYIANSYAPACVKGYFDNGGTRLRMSRTVHFTDVNDPTTKQSAAATLMLQTEILVESKGFVLGTQAAPFDLTAADDLDFSVDGGGTDTATIDAGAATVIGTVAETYALTDGWSFTYDTQDGTQTIVFATAQFVAIGAATAAEVAAVINSQSVGIQAEVDTAKVRITTDHLGTDASLGTFADVTGTPLATLGFTGLSDTGTGDCADINAVTIAELKIVIEADVTGVTVSDASGYVRIETDTPGSDGSAQVEATSTADDELGLDNAEHTGNDAGALNTLKLDAKTDGTFANTINATKAAPSNGRSGYFKLIILDGTLTLEPWDNVTMDDTSDDFVETVVNHPNTGSNYVIATDQDANVDSPDDIPAAGTTGPMTGGADGLGSLDDNDYTGGKGTNGETGLRTFDQHDDVDVMSFAGRATSASHNGLVTYCDITREGLLFAILDPPAGYSATQMATYIETTASLFGLTENAAGYWPQVKVANPQKSVYGTDDEITIPPSGHVSGVYARTDASKIGGAFEQPGGTDKDFLPRNVTGLETDEVLDYDKRSLVFDLNWNPISKERGTQFFLDGVRNLDITGNWGSIGQRRGVMFVEKRLIPGLAFMRHRNMRAALYKSGKKTTVSFMNDLTDAGAFKSKKRSTAYSVDFGLTLNNAAVQSTRTIKARVGMATAGPAEKVYVLVGPDSDELQQQLEALAA